MLKRKSILSLTTATLLTAVTFTGCTSSDNEKEESESTLQTTVTGTETTTNTNSSVENSTDTVISNTDISGKVDNHQLADLVGSVTGFVKDTNGNPIVGAKVYLGSLEVVTNGGGIYNFPEVPVPGLSSDCTNCTQTLTVSIKAPDGYLGGTVKVTPRNATMVTNSANDTTNDTGTTISNVFADGFVAAAPDAMLPKLGASVEGVIRNNDTGEAVSGASVIIDFKGIYDSSNLDTNEDKTLSTDLAISEDYTVTTGTDGKFTIPNLPEDAILSLKVKTHDIVEASDQDLNGNSTNGETISAFDFDTHFESDVEFKNLRVVAAGDSGDQIKPTIKTVDNSIGYTADRLYTTADKNGDGATGNEHNRTVLAEEVLTSKEIIINFTEPVDTTHFVANNAQAIVIKTENESGVMIEDEGADAELSSTQLKVTLTNELAEGRMIDINVKKLSVQDMAGNTLCDGDYTLNTCEQAQEFVRDKGDYLTVLLQTFSQLNLNAAAVAGSQMKSHDDTDTAYNAYNSVIDNANGSTTCVGGTTTINGVEVRQLNVAEAEDRLRELGGKVTQAVVDVNTTRISFTPTNSAQYKIEVKDKNGNATGNIEDFKVGTVTDTNGATITGNVGASSVSVKTDSAKVEFVVADVVIGDTVTITPYDDLDYEGTSYTITLVDNVAPTTIIQNSYMGGAATTTGASTVAPFGNGGELTNDYSVSATVGTPILGITPGLLDNLNGSGENILSDNGAVTGDEKLQYELYEHNTMNTTADPDVRYITAENVYDLTAYKVFAANLSRNVGVAFSEDIDLTGVTPTFEGTNIGSTYTAINDIVVDDSGDAVSADLVEFTTSDVLALANDDHGKVLDFNGIKDASGNPSNSAKVVVHDMMPPFVTSAKYDGTLIVTFNEPVNITSATGYAPELNVSALNSGSDINTTNVVGLNDLTKWSLSSDKKTLTVSDAATLSPVFTTAVSYIESDYSSTEALYHSVLDFSSIRDLQGNSWDTWATSDVSDSCDQNDTVGASTTDRVDLATPLFALVSMIGDFQYSTDNGGFTVDANTTTTAQTVIWTFNQELNVSGSDLFSANGTSVTTDATINTWFEAQSEVNSSIPLVDATISLDTTGKIVTLVFKTVEDTVNGNDAIRVQSIIGKNFISKVDTAQTESVTASANN
jgi:hypothetical protein